MVAKLTHLLHNIKLFCIVTVMGQLHETLDQKNVLYLLLLIVYGYHKSWNECL